MYLMNNDDFVICRLFSDCKMFASFLFVDPQAAVFMYHNHLKMCSTKNLYALKEVSIRSYRRRSNVYKKNLHDI